MSKSEYEQRSKELADTTRRYSVALNTGGVAVSFAFAGTLAGVGISPSWVVESVAMFVIGLCVTGISLFLAKHKALARLKAEIGGKELPNFASILWANFTYEIIALVCFVAGVVIGLWRLTGPGMAHFS